MAELAIAAAGSALGGMAISGGILTAAGSLTVGAQIGWFASSLPANTAFSPQKHNPREENKNDDLEHSP